MIAEFNWWLLIVGLVAGVGLTWLVLADTRRREVDLEERELVDEAAWLSGAMADQGEPVPPDVAERLLRLHRLYLAISGPPDELDEDPSAEAVAADSVRDAPVVERDHPEPEPPVRNVG